MTTIACFINAMTNGMENYSYLYNGRGESKKMQWELLLSQEIRYTPDTEEKPMATPFSSPYARRRKVRVCSKPKKLECRIPNPKHESLILRLAQTL